jgi:hypothetical protein
MCGEVRKSVNANQAVEYAIAYAKSFEQGDNYSRWGDGLPDSSKRREIAEEFIGDYTPAVQRPEALAVLSQRTELDSKLEYWENVVD